MKDSFEKLLVALSRGAVDYILVGGLAVALCGYVRATLDVAILVRVSDDNLRRMLGVLSGFGEGAAAELTVADFPLEEGSVRVVEAFPLDIFTQMSGHTFDDLLPYTGLHNVDDQPIRYLNPEGLILLKAESLRPKDQLDVQALRALQRDQS